MSVQLTEASWDTCDKADLMLAHLDAMRAPRFKWGRRKLRLLAVACCRAMQHLLEDERSRTAIEVAERFADGEATTAQREKAEVGAYHAWQGNAFRRRRRYPLRRLADQAAAWVTDKGAFAAAKQIAAFGGQVWAAGGTNRSADAFPCDLIREVFGNPFRTQPVPRSVLKWEAGTVVNLAQSIYDEKAFERMPVLADALEDAGCTDAAVLAHCRTGEHCRGCWVLDRILKKA